MTPGQYIFHVEMAEFQPDLVQDQRIRAKLGRWFHKNMAFFVAGLVSTFIFKFTMDVLAVHYLTK